MVQVRNRAFAEPDRPAEPRCYEEKAHQFYHDTLVLDGVRVTSLLAASILPLLSIQQMET